MAIAAGFAGCVAGPAPNAAHGYLAESPGAYWIRTELFFGLSKPDGSLISADAWNAFLDEQILRRFQDGLTVIDGTGRYLDSKHVTVKEPSKIVIIVYPPDRAAAADRDIAVIVTEYCSQFDQESVLRSDSTQKVSFPTAHKKSN